MSSFVSSWMYPSVFSKTSLKTFCNEKTNIMTAYRYKVHQEKNHTAAKHLLVVIINK